MGILKFTENFDEMYWAYNLPLQMWPNYDNYATNQDITEWRVLNYSPRKDSVSELWQNVSKEELPDYCHNASTILRNLASQFDALAKGKINEIYYPDKEVE